MPSWFADLYIQKNSTRRLKLSAMASSDPLKTLEQKNGGGHQCISPPPESKLAASIQESIDGVPPLYSECCIYRVPERLRKINEEAYTPLFVSIGPFHHGKENLKVQETLKRQHLRSFVGRNPGVKLSQYVKTIKEKEERIRKCYAENITGNSDEFVKMMLVDGCFILEHIISVVDEVCNTKPWFLEAIGRDLILLENQLPLFVLEDLYKLNRGSELATLTSTIPRFVREDLYNLGMLPAEGELAFVREGFPSDPAVPLSTETSSVTVDIPAETSQKIMHLLDFVRDCLIPSSGNGNSEDERETDDDASRVLNCTSLYPWNWSCFIPSSSDAYTLLSENKELQLPHNVTALNKAGVKLEVGSAGILDLSFKNGVLAIPCICIYDRTESVLRNMIAFEQLYCVGGRQYITDYATLMDNLIDTSKDVELLHDKGIIKNSLGDHAEVSLLFNKLVKEVAVDEGQNFCFYGLCQKLNAYHRFWHRWMADLRQTYFNTPWTAISVIAAVVLIVLTFLQTIYTIKSYIKQ